MKTGIIFIILVLSIFESNKNNRFLPSYLHPGRENENSGVLKTIIVTESKQITKLPAKSLIKQIVPPFFVKDVSLRADTGCIREIIDQGRSYESQNIGIAQCYFSRSSPFSGNGGIICVSGGSYSMSVNNSIFFKCSCSSGHGGAIYFVSYNSYLRMICAKNCSASSQGHFAYLQASSVNQLEYLSVLCCSYAASGYNSVHLRSGTQRFDITNSSMNNAIYGSGILIDLPSSFSSTFCTFSNNKASDCICIYIYSTLGTTSVCYANIVYNNSPTRNGVIYVEGGGSRKMLYCIFQNNQNYLFCVCQSSLEVSHSFIDHSPSSFSSNIAVLTATNNSLTHRITYQIQYFDSFHCDADIPFYDKTPQNTINISPMRSFEETIRRTIDQTIRESLKITSTRTFVEFTHQIIIWKDIIPIFQIYLMLF